MIVGVGLDVCSVDRLAAALERVPGLRTRLFAPQERDLPVASLAARFAAKEALAKALTDRSLSWTDAWVERADDGRPLLRVTGGVAAAAERLGVTDLHVSLTHDAGIAQAVVIAERNPAPAPADPRSPQ